MLREQKLRADPNVDVLGPIDVRCKRCGTHIKLSMKSTYDPFHWQRHIERCTKRPMSAIKQGLSLGRSAEKVGILATVHRVRRGAEVAWG